MKLTVLGSSAAFPAPGGAASGYLLQHDGFNLCLDLGTGTLSPLQEHIGIGEIHGVVSTNALELGIDIGSLQAAVVVGYPGTIASAWQQIGRLHARVNAA